MDRLLWFAGHSTSRRRWTPAEVARLESMVGKLRLPVIAAKLNRPLASVISKLQNLGYSIAEDVNAPLGLNGQGLARRLGLDWMIVIRHIHLGLIPAIRNNKRDFLISWPAVRAYERFIRNHQQRRARALARIPVKTITKQEFMTLIGLKETHATRYLQGGVVKAWKIPTPFTPTSRNRWEWRVSLPDALRVKRLRESGRLRLGAAKYKAIVRENQKTITELRRTGRITKRKEGLRPRTATRPNHLTVIEVSRRIGITADTLRARIRRHALPTKATRVGGRVFINIAKRDLPAYDALRPAKKEGRL